MLTTTDLRSNEVYVIYYNFWTKTILTELIPYVSLVFFNASIYKEIRRNIKIQLQMRCTQSQKEEIKSANVVVSECDRQRKIKIESGRLMAESRLY